MQMVDTTFPQGSAGSPNVGEAFTSLTQMAFEAAGGMDCHIRLYNGTMRSSKYIIAWLDSVGENGENAGGDGILWCIDNEIDDTHQDLTSEQLWTRSNIGEALDKGALIFDGRA